MRVIIQLFILGITYSIVNNQQDIVIKPTFIPVSTIDDTYHIVRTYIFPKDQFKGTIKTDFFVDKAFTKNPKGNTKDRYDIQNKNKPQDTVKEVKDTAVLQDHPPNLIPKRDSNPTRSGVKPLQRGALNVNKDTKIQWKIKVNKPLSPVVVENGGPIQIVDVSEKGNVMVEYGQEGKVTQEEYPSPPPYQSASNLQAKSTDSGEYQFGKEPHIKVKQNPQGEFKQKEQQRFEEHQKILIVLSACFLILVVIFLLVRSQKISKTSQLEKLSTHLQNYREDDEENSIFNQNIPRTSIQNLRETQLVDGDWSDDEERVYGQNSLVD